MRLERDTVILPAKEIPSFRCAHAIKNNTRKKWLIKTWGGLGDVVCAEPTIRYMIRRMRDHSFYLQTDYPELFRHLNFEDVFSSTETIDESKFYVVRTINDQSSLSWDFLSHALMQPVDYVSINMLRMQLPVGHRSIRLPEYESDIEPFKELKAKPEQFILVHPGRHWPSKTFPAEYWKGVVDELSKYFKVILIGKTVGESQGFVDFDVSGNTNVYDLRDYPDFGLTDLIAFCRTARLLLTNDSAPIHIAAAGSAYIGIISSCKKSDYLFHWRHGRFAWRMYDFARDNFFNYTELSPIREDELRFEHLPDGLMEKILPDPKSILENYLFWNEPLPYE